MISKNQIKFVRQLEQKKFRKAENLFIAETHKVVGDLLAAGFRPKHIFATNEWVSEHRSMLSTIGCPITEVCLDELTRLSLQQHPQQVLALFPIPDTNPTSAISHQPSSLSLLLDNVQDPGNLGTIIRIADWFGIDTIYCSPGTVDAWNPKVVQATMDYPIYGTFLDGENIYTQQLTSHGLIVMGNEGNGISDAVRARVSHKLLIPDFHNGDTADSLNVAIATAITCSEFRRRSL